MRRRALLSGIAATVPAVLAGCSDLTDDDSPGDDGADPESASTLEFEQWVPHTPDDRVTRVFSYDYSKLLDVDAVVTALELEPDTDVYGLDLDELTASILLEGSGWSVRVFRGPFGEDRFEEGERREEDSYGDYRVFADDDTVVGATDRTVVETSDGRDRLEATVDARAGSGPRLVDEDDDFERFVEETRSHRDIVDVNRNLDTVEGLDVAETETDFVEVAAFDDEESVEPYDEVRQPRELTDWERHEATYDHDIDGRFLTVEGSVATDAYFGH